MCGTWVQSCIVLFSGEYGQAACKFFCAIGRACISVLCFCVGVEKPRVSFVVLEVHCSVSGSVGMDKSCRLK